MDPIKDYQDVLQSIESAVAEVWRADPQLTNDAVMRTYEAAIAYYNAEARGLTPKPVNLTGLDAELYAKVGEMCEWRLGRLAGGGWPKMEQPIPVQDLVACLRKLNKSVEFWTKQGGRQGYLQHIEQFV